MPRFAGTDDGPALDRDEPTLRILMIFASIATTSACLNGNTLYDVLRDPAPITEPIVRWRWNGGRTADAAEVSRESDVMKAVGIGNE